MMVCVNKFNIVDSTATYFEEELLCYIYIYYIIILYIYNTYGEKNIVLV